MFEVTPKAVENLKNYLQENKVESDVRIALMQGGCSGASLGMALDTAGAGDKTFTEDEINFIVEESLLESCGDIKVDFVDAGYRSGFAITSTNPIGGCGSCSSCG